MGNQKMLVNVQEGETRIALTENNKLVDLHIEQTTVERTVGNIYRGVIVKVNPAFQAAFVEYGEKRNGFLSISDINPALFGGEGGRRSQAKIQNILKPGVPVMAQVLKEGVGSKGAALTTFISLPGRYLVLTPNSARSGVSRKIEDTEKRAPLKEILAGLVGSEKNGVIIRTAGLDRPAADLKKDLANLQKEWTAIEKAFQKAKKPGLLYREPASLLRVLRDYFSEEVEEVWVDSPTAFQSALSFFKSTLPKFQKRLQMYVGDKSLFSAHNIEPQIEGLDSNRVSLKSGGGIVIEPTEALVAIDVNSGKSNQASDVETTALNTNTEAAEEIARQLRLRNLGGLIVIDFIDMMQAKNRARIKQVLEDGLKSDKARTTLGSISTFGLLELTRQRISAELTRGSRVKCAHCGGTGFVPTDNASANSVLRRIRELAASGKYDLIKGDLSLDHANFLLNERRESLRDLEMEFDLKIILAGNPSMPPGAPVRMTGEKLDAEEEAEPTQEARPARESSAREAQAREPSPREAEPAAEARAGGEEEGGGRSRRRRRRGRGGRSGAEEAAPAQARGEETHAPADEPEQEGETAAKGPEWSEEDFLAPGSSRPAAALPVPSNGDRPEEPVAPSFAGLEGVPAGRTIAPTFGGKAASKRGGWLATIGLNAPVGDVLFSSAHKPLETEGEPVKQATFQRSKVFDGSEVEDNSVLFVSTHVGSPPPGEHGAAAAAPAPKGAKAGSRRGSGRGRGKAPAKGEGAKPAAKSAAKSETAKGTGKSGGRSRRAPGSKSGSGQGKAASA